MAPRGVALDARLRSVLLQAATQAGRTSLVQVLSEGASADVEKHVTMIKSCGSQRNLQGAKRVFDNLKRSGMPMNSLIYNCLIDACVQCGDAESALENFEQMRQLGLADVVSYNTVLKAHLRMGRFEEARALLKDMASSALSGGPAGAETYEKNNPNKKRVQTTDAGFARPWPRRPAARAPARQRARRAGPPSRRRRRRPSRRRAWARRSRRGPRRPCARSRSRTCG